MAGAVKVALDTIAKCCPDCQSMLLEDAGRAPRKAEAPPPGAPFGTYHRGTKRHEAKNAAPEGADAPETVPDTEPAP